MDRAQAETLGNKIISQIGQIKGPFLPGYKPKKKAIKRIAKELYRNYVRSCRVTGVHYEVKRWRDVIPDWKDYYIDQAKQYLLENSMNKTAR